VEREERVGSVEISEVERQVGDPGAIRLVPFDLGVSMVLGGELFLECFVVF
jgi:hypothetical protein